MIFSIGMTFIVIGVWVSYIGIRIELDKKWEVPKNERAVTAPSDMKLSVAELKGFVENGVADTKVRIIVVGDDAYYSYEDDAYPPDNVTFTNQEPWDNDVFVGKQGDLP